MCSRLTGCSVVVGDVNGQLTGIFDRLKALQAKQNFAFAIIAGNLFADASQPSVENNSDLARLLDGTIEVPLPTYFTLGKRELPQAVVDRLESGSGEVAPNLIGLGRRTRFKTSENINILTIGGVRQDNPSEQALSPWTSQYHDKDVLQAISYNEADIVVTSDWPTDVKIGSKVLCAGPATEEIQSLAKLCSTIKPRYYFSTSAAFFEREPFYHSADDKAHFTRFIALAPYGNINKEKYIYAFTLRTDTAQDGELPPLLTPSPFGDVRKRKLDSQKDAFNSFRFAAEPNGHHDRHSARSGKRRKQAPLQPRECYFCLSNPACETHMIGSIGENTYLTVAKGPLTTKSTFPDLGFPGHVLIIPLIHAPTLSSIPDEHARAATGAEMLKYREALHTMVASKGNLGSVTWDINRSSGVHNHWQFLPMPAQLLKQGLVEAAFKKEADALDYSAFRDESPEVEEIEQSDHFKITLSSDGIQKVMVMPLDSSFRFDLQFARRVLGKLLGLADRGDWKDCGQTKMEEESDTMHFKEAFKQYDFSLEG